MQKKTVDRNLANLIFQIIGSVMYCSVQFSLMPDYRLAYLEQDGAIDYFPAKYGFLANALVTLALSTMWVFYGFKIYYKSSKRFKQGLKPVIDDYGTGLVEEYPKVKHAFVLSSMMILGSIAGLLLPYVETSTVYPGLLVSLMACGMGAYVVYKTTPPTGIVVSHANRFMLQALPVWVMNWELCMLLFWILVTVDQFVAYDKSTIDNMNSPSPSPTPYHQKTATQGVACAFTIIAALIGTAVEANTRTFIGCLSTIFFLAAIAINGDWAFWFAIGSIIFCVVAQLIVIFLDLFYCRRNK